MTVYNVYDQLAELIATLPQAKVMSLKPPQETSDRFDELVDKSKINELSVTEKDELDHFIVLERILRLAKIRAKLNLS
jgi:hypothetical protein